MKPIIFLLIFLFFSCNQKPKELLTNQPPKTGARIFKDSVKSPAYTITEIKVDTGMPKIPKQTSETIHGIKIFTNNHHQANSGEEFINAASGDIVTFHTDSLGRTIDQSGNQWYDFIDTIKNKIDYIVDTNYYKNGCAFMEMDYPNGDYSDGCWYHCTAKHINFITTDGFIINDVGTGHTYDTAFMRLVGTFKYFDKRLLSDKPALYFTMKDSVAYLNPNGTCGFEKDTIPRTKK